jgi:hypothetical protein
MRDNSIRLLQSLMMALVTAALCADAFAAEQKKQSLVDVILAAVPQPAAGEFATAESVAAYLLRCVKDRDFDNSLKCFPIRQHYENITFDVSVAHLGVFSTFSTPLPERGFHNLSLAMQYTTVYERLSWGLLGIDWGWNQVIETDTEAGAAKLKELRSSLDVSKLKKVAVDGIKVSMKLPKERLSSFHKALGVEESCIVEAAVRVGSGEAQTAEFLVGKIGDNWRILVLLS